MVSFESSQKLPLPPKMLFKAGFNIKTYFFNPLGFSVATLGFLTKLGCCCLCSSEKLKKYFSDIWKPSEI